MLGDQSHVEDVSTGDEAKFFEKGQQPENAAYVSLEIADFALISILTGGGVISDSDMHSTLSGALRLPN